MAVPAGAFAAMAPGSAAAVERLVLTDFRCYGRLRLETAGTPVILVGANGAGKTNILEALSFLAPGRGLRGARLTEPDRRVPAGVAAKPWAVAAWLRTPEGELQLGTGREAGAGESEKRAVRIDGLPARGQKDLARHLAVVWLTPEMDRLFDDGPGGRRRFLDRMATGFEPEHAAELAAYEHARGERARLLAAGGADAVWLDALEDSMARHGVAVAAARAGAVRRLNAAIAEAPGAFPVAVLALAGEVDGWLAQGPALDAEDRLRARLAVSRAQDAEQGAAAAGPHRSDLQVVMAARGEPAASCSTGEQKALLLSILLGHARALTADRGAAPLMLLDEVVAHLDRVRRAALFDALWDLGAQAWMTGTDAELFREFSDRAQMFRVIDAAVAPMGHQR